MQRDIPDSYRQDGRSIYMKWQGIPNVVERDISDLYRQDNRRDDRRDDRQDGRSIYKKW